jgi:hypothetical protein
MSAHVHIVGVLVGEDADSAKVEWHIASIDALDYFTACGMDGTDEFAEQHGLVTAKRGQKVTCKQCYRMWKGFRALTLREASFAPEAKR